MKESTQRRLFRTLLAVIAIFSAIMAAGNTAMHCIITLPFKIQCQKETLHPKGLGDKNILMAVKDVITGTNTVLLVFVLAVFVFAWVLIKDVKTLRR